MNAQALSGLKVLEYGEFVAAPTAANFSLI